MVGYGTPFDESEMALFFECMLRCVQKLLDTADIVREAMPHAKGTVFKLVP